ncbi:MAG: bifunctional glycosyltransferase family 2/GtrA family protein [Christensenellaceae bacterium]|nr:bifunctional glycosyltransferase family 2/GtrA family protein [Christensenellaceae bacterium]
MIAVIPAYDPDEKLLNLIMELQSKTDYLIVVVNDGSDNSNLSLFDEIERSVTVLHHEVNKGKGRAMKTAFEWIKAQGFSNEGIITVDADGQHLIDDIKKVSEVWRKHPEALVLGSRMFTGKVPFKSRFGNGITRAIFATSTGVRVYDTQTGLRAFSTELIDRMIAIDGERYEYEINQLLTCTRQHIPIVEETIETVYINKNETSHFDVIKDSWKIYRTILAFAGSSIISWIVDYLLLLLLTGLFSAITNGAGFNIHGFVLNFTAEPKLPALVIARIVSSIVNYVLNKNVVFSSKSRGSVFRYYVLAVIVLAVNYLLLHVLDAIMPLWLAQIIVQLVIYPVNFVAQRKFVFHNKGN